MSLIEHYLALAKSLFWSVTIDARHFVQTFGAEPWTVEYGNLYALNLRCKLRVLAPVKVCGRSGSAANGSRVGFV